MSKSKKQQNPFSPLSALAADPEALEKLMRQMGIVQIHDDKGRNIFVSESFDGGSAEPSKEEIQEFFDDVMSALITYRDDHAQVLTQGLKKIHNDMGLTLTEGELKAQVAHFIDDAAEILHIIILRFEGDEAQKEAALEAFVKEVDDHFQQKLAKNNGQFKPTIEDMALLCRPATGMFAEEFVDQWVQTDFSQKNAQEKFVKKVDKVVQDIFKDFFNKVALQHDDTKNVARKSSARSKK